jgi:hypothetical protein
MNGLKPKTDGGFLLPELKLGAIENDSLINIQVNSPDFFQKESLRDKSGYK